MIPRRTPLRRTRRCCSIKRAHLLQIDADAVSILEPCLRIVDYGFWFLTQVFRIKPRNVRQNIVPFADFLLLFSARAYLLNNAHVTETVFKGIDDAEKKLFTLAASSCKKFRRNPTILHSARKWFRLRRSNLYLVLNQSKPVLVDQLTWKQCVRKCYVGLTY